MESFIKNVSKRIITERGKNLDKILIVLPNKRPISFLKKALSEELTVPTWSPIFTTINEFVGEYSSLKQISSLETLIYAFQVIGKDTGESFEHFLSWAPNLLTDFNEMDLYLLDYNDVFKNLRDIKEIEQWSFNTDELSDAQNAMIKRWEIMPKWYTELQEALKKEGVGYSGMIYKEVALNCDKLLSDLPFEHIYFSGFNALSKAEQHIITYLQNIGKATAIFDYDQFYGLDKDHEAGMFYRQFKERATQPITQLTDYLNGEKEITIVDTPSDVVMTKAGSELLHTIENPESTVIVPASEVLLEPLVSVLPEALKINVSAGISVASTSVKSLIELLFDIVRHRKQRNGLIHHSYFQRIVDNNYIRLVLTKEELKALEHVRSNLRKTSRLYANPQEFGFSESHPLQFLFVSEDLSLIEVSNFIEQSFQKAQQKEEEPIMVEALAHFLNGVDRLKTLLEKYKLSLKGDVLKIFLRQFMAEEKISLLGDPAKGIQLMGLLEARMVDFDEVIIVGMNEGMFPASVIDTSFIPYDLRHFLGLPTYKEKDAIFSHHFYRLITRAKKIKLIYNRSQQDKGELSRFVLQMQKELTNASFNYLSYQPEEVKPINFSYDRSHEEVQKRLIAYMEGGISPSAINKYLNCELDFFNRYVLGIKESNEFKDSIEDNTLGSIVHGVLEDYYEDFVGEILNPDILEQKLHSVKKLLDDQIEKNGLKQSYFRYGKNLILKSVMETLAQDFILWDIARCRKHEVQLISQEDTFYYNFPFELNGTQIHAKLTGKIDRLEKVDGVLNIMDYKTGKAESKDLGISSATAMAKDKDKARQLAAYLLLASSKHPFTEAEATIASLRSMHKGLVNLQYEKAKVLNPEFLAFYHEQLIETCIDMLTSTKPVRHNPDYSYCDC